MVRWSLLTWRSSFDLFGASPLMHLFSCLCKKKYIATSSRMRLHQNHESNLAKNFFSTIEIGCWKEKKILQWHEEFYVRSDQFQIDQRYVRIRCNNCRWQVVFSMIEIHWRRFCSEKSLAKHFFTPIEKRNMLFPSCSYILMRLAVNPPYRFRDRLQL